MRSKGSSGNRVKKHPGRPEKHSRFYRQTLIAANRRTSWLYISYSTAGASPPPPPPPPREEDPDQGLSNEGRSDVERIAGVCEILRCPRVVHRAQREKESPRNRRNPCIGPRTGKRNSGEIRHRAPGRRDGHRRGRSRPKTNLMLVGHLPFMERLTSFLVTGSLQYRVFRFQNGGIVCLDREFPEAAWHIKWALMPKID